MVRTAFIFTIYTTSTSTIEDNREPTPTGDDTEKLDCFDILRNNLSWTKTSSFLYGTSIAPQGLMAPHCRTKIVLWYQMSSSTIKQSSR